MAGAPSLVRAPAHGHVRIPRTNEFREEIVPGRFGISLAKQPSCLHEGRPRVSELVPSRELEIYGLEVCAMEEATLLVVDDEPANLQLIRLLVEELELPVRVATAGNALDAVALARALGPSLVLMDLKMPGIDGWEATRRLKADDRTRAIPVIALTGHALAGHSKGAMEAGCDAFITKPCLPERLLEEIQAMFEGRRSTTTPERGR
jgi:two-component system cell cycle response regulator DivK